MPKNSAQPLKKSQRDAPKLKTQKRLNRNKGAS